jgi:hypothetical protein
VQHGLELRGALLRRCQVSRQARIAQRQFDPGLVNDGVQFLRA